ncbi:MFS transporter [Winogradskya consettensis]|uniref:MFS transporter n=1 Tax=Winogradskya consettensis TaxID=113560 RepID=A0A919SRN5_9ACTN|nr:MFS transporter [Actinoplanes consettensis]GIM75833.1 MFS transporter [Actinoplanes consettensis]
MITTSEDKVENKTAGQGILKDSAFRHLWAGMTASKFGSSIASIATPLIAVQVLDASAFLVSLLTAAVWLPWLLIGLPAGAWIDRIARRPVMLVSDLLAAVVVISVPVAAWLGVLTVGQLIAVEMLLGCASVFFTVAWTAYLPAMFNKDRLVGANSILQGTESTAQVAGPALGGVLIAAVTAATALVADAVSFLVSAFFIWRIRRPETRPERPEQRESIREDIAAGIRWLARDRFLRNLTIHGATANLVLTGMNALLIVFLVREIGLGTTGVGLLMAITAVGGVGAAAAAPVLARRFGAARTMVGCKTLAGVAATLVPLTRPGAGLAIYVVGMIAMVFGVVAGNVLAGSFRQAYCPPHLLARVVTGMQFVNLGAIPVGAVLGGAVATAFGVRTAITIMTLGYAVSGLILLLGPFRGRRDLPASPADVTLAG